MMRLDTLLRLLSWKVIGQSQAKVSGSGEVLLGKDHRAMQRLIDRTHDEVTVLRDHEGIETRAEAADGSHAGHAARLEPAYVVVDVAELDIHQFDGDRIALLVIVEEQRHEGAELRRG